MNYAFVKTLGRGERPYASSVGTLRFGAACPQDIRPYIISGDVY
jgi:hypothetical protein